ncbi:MAG: oligosaccharide flippase family protein [Crocinitomicaceae bacterium]|nr:oligosaccharide flippase family protein [Crocinitomicaceae bacterium]
MSGTAIAQLMNLGLSIILYQFFYSPEEGAELGLFARIIGVGAAIVTARYEFAMPIAKADVHSFRLYKLAFRLALISSGITSIIVLIPMFLSGNISDALFYGLIPIGMFLTAYYSIGTNWAIRTREFRSISFSKVANVGVGGGIKLLLGWLGSGYIGLIVGTVAGLFVANGWFARTFRRMNSKYDVKAKSPRTKLLAKTYEDFPKVNLPHTMMDVGRELVVAIIILQLFTKADFGLYDHSLRMLRMPLMLAGLAISQVFFQNCAERFNKGEDIFPVVLKAVKVLLLLSIVPFGLVFLFGNDLFAWVFSEKWRGAGEFAQIMAPWFMLNFVASPISFLPLILGKQKQFFVIAIVGAVVNICSFWIPDTFFQADIKTTLWIVTVTQVANYLFIIFKTFQYLKQVKPG